ncbi:twin-arginine translocase subunit TatC [Coraliomargarita parva]|uniref:twin-arginine translocase subunit TatC n=1 Tax=Coraliomargarita parva TaxID=3014050 RepID=UPI0022B53109|nr:twin-arginine translocase subunit TatC [Coraliomargarita parva]
MTDSGLDKEEFDEELDVNGNMSFLEHLEEFRWTLARSVGAFLLGAILVACFLGQVSDFLQYPLRVAYGSAEVAEQQLVTRNPMGVFSVFIQIVFLGGFTLSLPFMLYFLGRFIAPGLNEREKRILIPSCFAAFVLFIAGVAFSFFAVLPLTLSFCVRLNNYFHFTLWWTATDYFSMVVWFSIALGGFFQFPLITVILVVIGVVTVEQLKRFRRFVAVAIMVFAALLTPGGDPISLSIMSVPMYLLYELAILIGARFERAKRDKELAETDDL